MMSHRLHGSIAFGLLFVSLLPVIFVLDTVAVEHFFSSQHLFEYAFDHAFRFGQDIIDNVGPYGYLHYPYTYAGGAFWSKIFWFTCILALYAYYAVQLSTRIANPYHKLLFLGTLSLFSLQIDCPWYAYEVLPRFAVLFSALYFMDPLLHGNDKKIHLLVISLFYAFLILEKASNVYYIFLVIALLSCYWALDRNWKSIFYFMGGFFCGLISFWLVAAQPLSGLPIYFQSMHTFIDAYQNVLPEKTSTPDLVYALIYCLSIALLLIHRIKDAGHGTSSRVPVGGERSPMSVLSQALEIPRRKRLGMTCWGINRVFRKPLVTEHAGYHTSSRVPVGGERSPMSILSQALEIPRRKRLGMTCWGVNRVFHKPLITEYCRAMLIAALCFLTWKHGMFRGANSYGTFLFTVPGLVAFLCFYPGRTKALPMIGIALLLLILTNVLSYNREIHYPYNFYQQFYKRFSALWAYHPQQQHQALIEKFAQLKQDNALPPELKQLIADGTVDEFGSTPEILLLNNLNYRPRPIPIQFIVGNLALNQKNQVYYQDPKTAPDMVFLPNFEFQLSDTLTYLTILFNYRLISNYSHWFVMKKSAPWHSIHLKKIAQLTAPLNHWISVSDHPSPFLWVNISIKPSLLGKIKRFLYKSDLLYLDVELNNGQQTHHAVSLAQLESGFLLSPRPEAPRALHAVNDWRPIKAFRISLEKPKRHIYFQPNMDIQYSQVITG